MRILHAEVAAEPLPGVGGGALLRVTAATGEALGVELSAAATASLRDSLEAASNSTPPAQPAADHPVAQPAAEHPVAAPGRRRHKK